ncbi:MAG: PEP-CTERM sorting domain-containing protein [Isosphaeraceae bacterium]|nr:PEP-CTERM sorting domain-containing protein [Isosphaeraceae bacterium]
MAGKNALFWCLCVLTAASPARAMVLPPGGTVTPDAQSNPLTDPTATVLNSASGTFNADNIVLGSYKEWVVRESSGTLDFVYQVTNAPASLTAIESVSMYHFVGFTANVGYVAGSGDRDPSSAWSSPSGTVLSFNFPASNALPTGLSSDLLVIRTNATQYDSTGTFSFLGGAATTVPGFAPSAVPEPTSLALVALGGAGLIAGGRLRRSARAAEETIR